MLAERAKETCGDVLAAMAMAHAPSSARMGQMVTLCQRLWPSNRAVSTHVTARIVSEPMYQLATGAAYGMVASAPRMNNVASDCGSD